MASSADGGFLNERIIIANGAPLDSFRGPSEENIRFKAADADRGPFEARKEYHLRHPAHGPLRSTEDPLRLMKDILRRADGTMNRLAEYCRLLHAQAEKGDSKANGSSPQVADRRLSQVGL